jgi:hypothetical protein
MYRFDSLGDYNKRLDQLTLRINYLKNHQGDVQSIVNYEALKLSYIIEKLEFESNNKN